MTEKSKAEAIVNKMFNNDAFSKWLGIDIINIEKGSCELKMKVRGEMLNGFGLAHGGITYSLADSALAFASNSNGRHALSIDTQIFHTAAVREKDELLAKVTEINRSRNLACYTIEISNQNKKLVAHFSGSVFIKTDEWNKR